MFYHSEVQSTFSFNQYENDSEINIYRNIKNIFRHMSTFLEMKSAFKTAKYLISVNVGT